MSFVADIFTSAVETVASIVVDIVTFDIRGLVDTAAGMVEGIIHTVTHPTEDPFATIMLAVAVYMGVDAATSKAAANAATAKTATAASKAAIAKATAAKMTAAQVAAAGVAASNAVINAAAGASTVAASTSSSAI